MAYRTKSRCTYLGAKHLQENTEAGASLVGRFGGDHDHGYKACARRGFGLNVTGVGIGCTTHVRNENFDETRGDMPLVTPEYAGGGRK